MVRKPYADDPGASEFTGDGQRTSEGHGALPGVGVVPDGVGADLVEWYWTEPADVASAPAENYGSIGDDSVTRNRPQK
jgi:hypothetical protein